MDKEKSIMREPILAAILSFLFMGLGQAYNGQRRKGYIFFLGYFGLGILYFILLKVFNEPFLEGSKEVARYTSPSYIITLICGLIIWICNIYDAYQTAKRINEGSVIVTSTPGRSSLIFLRTIFLGFIFIIGLIIVLVLIFVFFLLKH